MAECMTFPNTFDEFLEQYQFRDSEKVYTNGSMLVPVFRVKQWVEHATSVFTNADRIRSMTDEELAAEMSVRLSEDCLMCPVLQADCPVWERKDIECGQAMLDWLKQEVEQDEP